MLALMATRRNPRRTIALGDLHGSLDAFRTILTRAGLVEGDSWRGGRSIFVQLGDVIDRGPASLETYQFLADLQVRARKGRGMVVRLLGNHEVSLLEGYYDLANFPEPEKLAERIREDALEGKVQAAFVHGGWLFTHAGLHYNLLTKLRAEMKVAEGKPRRFTPRRLASHLNAQLLHAVRTNDFTHPIFAVGKARGGDQTTGGIFWADFDEELEAPRRAPLFHQVFAHTPEGYEGARYRRTEDGRRINIDIGIAEEYGGNLGYLEILGTEAIAHYLTDEGDEETESLGRSRKAPAPKPPAADTAA